MGFTFGHPRPVITLTTDFGSRDGYVAAMKGVILDMSPGATLVDISHDLPAHDVGHAAFLLGAICGYFPVGTVHVAIVDPGVGTERRSLVVVTPHGTYVAPDNGLLTYVYERYCSDRNIVDEPYHTFMSRVPDLCKAYVLDCNEYWARQVSNTFHGRDIFAPVAAHLSAGVDASRLGTPVRNVVSLNVPRAQSCGDTVEGRVIYVDRFGNMVSNIRSQDIVGKVEGVEIGGRRIPGLSSSYAGPGLLAILGSHGYIEVAVSEGSACEYLGLGLEAVVRVTLSRIATLP